MVFESVVANLINRYLGDFVEDLDTSQLKVGLWNGNIMLKNLSIKESALDTWNLPVKIKAGRIGKLVLNIPWKNMYTEPLVIEMKDVYALAVPNVSVNYNEEKEESDKQEAKQQKLARIEDAKKLKTEKDLPKSVKQDTFVEKLSSNVIKNLQLTVSNVHIRYEDSFTNPKRPFSVGVCLKELLFRTADKNWKPCVIKEAVTHMFKLVRLDHFSIYWNSLSLLSEGMEKEDILDSLQDTWNIEAATDSHRPAYDYIIRPIFIVAHLKLNAKPEQSNFTEPKISMVVVFDEIALCLSKDQVDDMQELMLSMERMETLSLYRKYRPVVPLVGNYRTWWRYAYHSILEETVRRRRRMWSWSHIVEHRRISRNYRKAYIEKLRDESLSVNVLSVLEKGEAFLDVFNITLMRQQAEMKEAKLEVKQTIDYQENEVDHSLPTDFVALKVVMKLKNVTVFLWDEQQNVQTTRQRKLSFNECQVMNLQLKDMFCSFRQRPAANAFVLEAKVDRLVVNGTLQSGVVPKVITSQPTESEQVYSLLTLAIETNPLDGCFDTSIKIKTRPLEIIYDANTVNKLYEFFTPPESVLLSTSSKRAMAEMEAFKELTTSGIQYVRDQHKYTDIYVDIMSSYVIVPEGGVLRQKCKILVLDLGQLKVTSQRYHATQDTDSLKSEAPAIPLPSTSAMNRGGLEKTMAKAYDKFYIRLSSIQLLFADSDTNWLIARDAGQSPLHILSPVSILLDVGVCILSKDPRMPAVRVSGVLPNLSLCVSDVKMQEIVVLLRTLPVPEYFSAQDDELYDDRTGRLPGERNKKGGHPTASSSPTGSSGSESVPLDSVNLTDTELVFEIKEIVISVLKEESKKLKPCLKLTVQSVGSCIQMRTFDIVADAYLGAVCVQYLDHNLPDVVSQQLKSVKATGGPLINLVHTPSSTKLLTVHYLQAHKTCPDFSTSYKNTEVTIHITISALELLLHQEAIITLTELAQLLAPPPEGNQMTMRRTSAVLSSSVSSIVMAYHHVFPSSSMTQHNTFRAHDEKPKDPDIISMKIESILNRLSVGICNSVQLFTHVHIKDMKLTVLMQEQQTTIITVLKEMELLDPDPDTMYRKIIQIEDSDAFKAQIVLFTDGSGGKNYSDMSCVDFTVNTEIGGIRVIYVNKFVDTMLGCWDTFLSIINKVPEVSEAGRAIMPLVEKEESRIGLKIQVKTLVIVLPTNCLSLNSLIVDLGHLSISNVFKIGNDDDPSGVTAVLEEMEIAMTSFRLSRATLEKDGSNVAECTLLEPQPMSMTVQRNLSAEWYHEAPDLVVTAALGVLTFRLNEWDYDTVMQVWAELLPGDTEPSTAMYKPNDPSGSLARSSTTLESSQSLTNRSEGEFTRAAVPTSLKVDIRLEGLNVYFYTADYTLMPGRQSHAARKALVKMDLQTLSMISSSFRDGSIIFRVSMVDAIIDDMRMTKQSGITRMTGRSTGSQNTTSVMIVMEYTQNTQQDTTIRLSCSGIYICMCLEFMLAVWDFFTKNMQKKSSGTTMESAAMKDATVMSSKEEHTAETQGFLDIHVDMENPEIVLIEDQSNRSTNIFVVDMIMSFHMILTLEKQVVSASLCDLQMFSSTFDQRHGHLAEVLLPCDLTFQYNTIYSKSTHIYIHINDLVLYVSPATIRSMAALYASLQLSPEASMAKSTSSDSVQMTSYINLGELWSASQIKDRQFWCLQRAEGYCKERAGVQEPSPVNTDELDEVMDEQMTLILPSFVVKLEGGMGHQTMPLLIAESSLQAQIRNWSSQMSAEGSIALEMGYYNEKLVVWEPLIEPIIKDGETRRWKINFDVQMNDDNSSITLDDKSPQSDEHALMLPSKMVISIRSSDVLQMTVTVTCIDVLTNLSKAFNDEYNVELVTNQQETVLSPYLFKNQTEFDMELRLDSSFELPPSAADGKIKLGAKDSLPVDIKQTGHRGSVIGSHIVATQKGEERKLSFQLEKFGAANEVTIKRAERRLFHIGQHSQQGDIWSIVCDTDCTLGQKLVSLHSIVRIKNELQFAVQVQHKTNGNRTACGVAQPEQFFSLPLTVVYALPPELSFQPVQPGYYPSMTAFNWHSAVNEEVREVYCPSTKPAHSACQFSVYTEIEQIYFQSEEEKTRKCYLFVLQPSVILHNLLPVAVQYMLEKASEQQTLQPGENCPLRHVSRHSGTVQFIVLAYTGHNWVGKWTLQKNMPELTLLHFRPTNDEHGESLELGVRCKLQKGSLDVSVYSPYWLINKTARTLYYRGPNHDAPVIHAADETKPVLFSFMEKSTIGGKKKKLDSAQSKQAQLKIDDYEWSDKFSLDIVGSYGTVNCNSKSKEKLRAEVGVSIQLSTFGLTNIVTFTPFYMLLNATAVSIMVTENDGQSDWVDVAPEQCLPFWPCEGGKDVTLQAKVKGTDEVTGPFLINNAHITLLKLENQYGGIGTECRVSESSMVTTLRPYSPGLATVRVVNHTKHYTVSFYQIGEQSKDSIEVECNHTVLYTWHDALGKRVLVWSCGKKRNVKTDLADGMDEFFADEDTKVYCVSFLEGLKRMLLFTEEMSVAVSVQQTLDPTAAGEMEQIEQEINLQIQGFGLSLVNDHAQKEVAFLSITSSGILWEERKKRRYRPLEVAESELLEAAWQKYHEDLANGRTPKTRIVLANKMELDVQEQTLTVPTVQLPNTAGYSTTFVARKMDFTDMTVVRPQTIPIRRSFEYGIWLQYKTSAHRLQFHSKINRLQLDNQLCHGVFPIVLSPIPPPKSVSAERVTKTFFEVSLYMKTHEHSNVSQINYFKVLIQEMHVKIDQGFLLAILELVSANEPVAREHETIQFKQDMILTEKTLMESAGLSVLEENKNVYDFVHFSPIKMHVSFSLQTGDGKASELQAGGVGLFLRSVGVVLTDVQDVIFKLGYFERSHSLHSQAQLIRDMMWHYTSQAIKQMYVLVLGLNVLGNPFGLLRGLSEGIEDLFYEPYHGAIQGPKEFAEGLALGVRSLFGHTVGGAAGTVSRITGTLGKGLATLTLDDDYQKSRREAQNKPVSSAKEGFAQGGKHLIMGVVHGVSGIVRHPVQGAMKEGVSGFAKGVGKGLVGVVARPTSGVVDFASSSLEGIRRLAEVRGETKRVRHPRRFFKDRVIRHYDPQDAEGFFILQEMDRGRYAVTDQYQTHVMLGIDALLVTDKRVLMAKRGLIFATWDSAWAYVWTDLDGVPKTTSQGIDIVLRPEKKKSFFSSGAMKKEVLFSDPKLAQLIVKQIRDQMVISEQMS